MIKQFPLDHWGVAALGLIRELDSGAHLGLRRRAATVRRLFALAKASGDIPPKATAMAVSITTDHAGVCELRFDFLNDPQMRLNREDKAGLLGKQPSESEAVSGTSPADDRHTKWREPDGFVKPKLKEG